MLLVQIMSFLILIVVILVLTILITVKVVQITELVLDVLLSMHYKIVVLVWHVRAIRQLMMQEISALTVVQLILDVRPVLTLLLVYNVLLIML